MSFIVQHGRRTGQNLTHQIFTDGWIGTPADAACFRASASFDDCPEVVAVAVAVVDPVLCFSLTGTAFTMMSFIFDSDTEDAVLINPRPRLIRTRSISRTF
eukprot:GFYU01047145.1.p1 GENE.GFYU01047145.1~~GFYU01047145.1.p1  ORF type:complete len:101 (+),score=11.96 GFYU01047145.1:186-488(+)